MTDSVNVESRFSPLPVFTPNHHHLLIKRIDFDNKIAFVELEIEGKLSRLLNNYVKFTSVLPLITQVHVCINEEEWVESQFENLVNDSAELVDLPDDDSRLIDKKVLIRNILNHEDSMGGTNLYVYIPPSILSRLHPSSVVKIKFAYYFPYRPPKHDIGPEFDGYYLDIFGTPFDYNFPSCGYKPCLWMPSLNQSVFSTTWEIEVAVPHDMTAVATGNLQIVVQSEDSKIKIWSFQIKYPTTAGNISVFVGYFNSIECNDLVTGYSTFGVQHLLEPCLDFIPRYIEYFSSILNTSFPHTKLHLLFISQANKCAIFSNLFVFPTSFLCSKCNVLQMHKNYRLFAAALSDYVFGALIKPRTISDIWLICGIGRFIYYNFIKHFFGISEYYHVFKKEMKRACSYPNSETNICFYLTPHVFLTNVFHESTESLSPAAALKKWYATSHPRLISYTKVWKCFVARCGLTIKSIEKVITPNHLLQVISKIASFNSTTISQFNIPSTEFFFTSILNVSGKDIFLQICRNWLGIYRPLLLTLEYVFNRRRSCMEITLINDDHELECNIPVNISITVQELDGAFEHSNLINRDAHRSTFEVSTHSSKSRRSNLKRRVTTENGREIDIELIQSSSTTTDVIVGADNPALWIRINMELCTFYGNVRIIQSDSAWYYQSMLESTPLGHLKAVKTIKSFPSGESIILLGKLIKNKSCWYQIRSEAFRSLVFIYNQLSNDDMIKIDKEHNPIDLYRGIFCLNNYPELPKINDFSDVSLYFFQLSAIKAISGLKMVLLKEVLKPRVFLGYELLRTLYEYNDNASNCYDDCCYRACLIGAIGDSLPQLKNDLLNDASVFVLTESLNSMKIDELCPYFHGCVSLSAISNLLKLQKLKFIEYFPTPFRHCCLPGIEERLRLSSVYCLAEYIQCTQSFDEYTFLLDLISIDSSPLFRHNCVKALIKFPPFQSSQPSSLLTKLNNENSHKYLYTVIEQVFSEQQSFSLFQQLTVYYDMLYADTSYSQPTQSDLIDQSLAVPELKQDGMLKIVIKSASVLT